MGTHQRVNAQLWAETSAPSAEPVTLAEARDWLKLDATGSPETHPDDDIVSALIAAARRQCEDVECHNQIVTATYTAKLDRFPAGDCDLIYLPKPPLQSVTSITYIDEDGATQTWDAANYIVHAPDRAPGFVELGVNKDWPDTRDQKNAVTITFVCGYGAASAVPDGIKQWILANVAARYETREAETANRVVKTYIDHLLDPYRLRRVG